MSVEFEGEQAGGVYSSLSKPRPEKLPIMIRILIKMGIAKNKRQANATLIILACLFIVVSLYLFQFTLDHSRVENLKARTQFMQGQLKFEKR